MTKAEFEDLIKSSESTKKDSQKKLTTPLLNKHFASAISTAEQQKVKLTYCSSTVNLTKLRAETKFSNLRTCNNLSEIKNLLKNQN